MLDDLKTGRQSPPGGTNRLTVYVAGLLVLGAVFLGISLFGSGEKGPSRLPLAPAGPAEGPKAPVIDLSRVPSADDAATWSTWQAEALDALALAAEQDLSSLATRTTTDDLAGRPFADLRGKVFEVTGRVAEVIREVWGGGAKRLWSVVLEGPGGARVVVLKQGLASDPNEGSPEDALRGSTEWIEVGDDLLVRGIYAQRRMGTIGTALLRDPVPVLVATPPGAGFRKIPPARVPISAPALADWEEVADRFLGETQVWEEPALFEVLQWARIRGPDAILADLRSGALKTEEWDRDLFDRWGREVELTDPETPRPVTEGLRGRLFHTRGLVGNFVRQGWDVVPRLASAWGIDTLYVVDLVSDHWGNRAMRCICPFPADAFPSLTGERFEHVTLTGYFLKNFTYQGEAVRDGAPADVTMPMFVVLHLENIPHVRSPYRAAIAWICGTLVLFALLFVLVLRRRDRREAARIEAYRSDLKRRRRAVGTPPAPGTGESLAPGDSPPRDPAPGAPG